MARPDGWNGLTPLLFVDQDPVNIASCGREGEYTKGKEMKESLHWRDIAAIDPARIFY